MPPNLPYGYVYADAPPSQPHVFRSEGGSRMSEARADPLFESPDTDSDSEDQSSIAPMKKAKTTPCREPRPSTTRTHREITYKQAANKNKHVEQDTCPKSARPSSHSKAPAMPFGVNGIKVTPIPSAKNHPKDETASELQERFASMKGKQPIQEVWKNQKSKSVLNALSLDSRKNEPVQRKARSSSASGLVLKGSVDREVQAVRVRAMSAGPMRPEANVRRVPRTREITREIKIYTSGRLCQEHKKGMARGFIVHIPCFDFKDPSTRCYCGHPGEHEMILQGIVHDSQFRSWIKLAKAAVMAAVREHEASAANGEHPNFSIICICRKGRHRWSHFCKSVS